MPAETVLQAPLLACLCAAWCNTCEAYREVLAAVAAAHPGWRVAWVDIEDEADRLAALPDGGPDIENFPTVLVCTAQGQGFLGTVLPQPGLLDRLLKQAEQGGLPPLPLHTLALAQALHPLVRP